MDNVFGIDPSEVHIHVRRIPLNEIPNSENAAAAWLIETFRFKDQLLSDFSTVGHFPQEGTEGELSTLTCLVNVAMVITSTSLFTFLTFFSSVWFKVYVALSCAYLASATYFNIRPSPIMGTIHALFFGKKSR